jgi:hypothetical protein
VPQQWPRARDGGQVDALRIDLHKVDGTLRRADPAENALEGDEWHIAPLAHGLAPAKPRRARFRGQERAAARIAADIEGHHASGAVGWADGKRQD